MEISGKTAIVTGAASGIGLGIATALAEAGANVVMADIEKDAVEQAAHRLSGTNKQVLPVRIDVTQEQSVIARWPRPSAASASSTSPATTPACRCTARRWSTCRWPTGPSSSASMSGASSTASATSCRRS
jgi:hypothetical protein